MITTTHARPHLHIVPRSATSLQKFVVCPRCTRSIGTERNGSDGQLLLSAHRCMSASRDMLQPSTAVPFS